MTQFDKRDSKDKQEDPMILCFSKLKQNKEL